MINEPIENYKTGFISIFRSIKRHWIWDDPIKFKWWIDIILTVNYLDKTINIGYDLFECKRGQSVQSLQSWAKEWNVSKDTVRNFFKLLEKDKMILIENLKKTTRITVCNYDSYQTILHDEQTQSKRKANAKQTQAHPNNKENKENNDNKETIPSFEEFKKYALEKEPNINLKSLKFKYDSWIENGWKTGKDKKIINWKSTLLNTIPHIGTIKQDNFTIKHENQDYSNVGFKIDK